MPQRIQNISDRLDQQSIGKLRCIHQKPEVAVIAGEQHMGLAGKGAPVDRPVFLGKISWTEDGGVVGNQPNPAPLMAEFR